MPIEWTFIFLWKAAHDGRNVDSIKINITLCYFSLTWKYATMYKGTKLFDFILAEYGSDTQQSVIPSIWPMVILKMIFQDWEGFHNLHEMRTSHNLTDYSLQRLISRFYVPLNHFTNQDLEVSRVNIGSVWKCHRVTRIVAVSCSRCLCALCGIVSEA